MAERSKKQQLVEFLDDKAFKPVLEASAKDFRTEREKKMLDHVKRSTRAEEKRYFEEYRTASEVRQRFLEDLSSKAAKKVDDELKQLGLPRLPELKEEFLGLCQQIGVK